MYIMHWSAMDGFFGSVMSPTLKDALTKEMDVVLTSKRFVMNLR
jgi:hypothetical protein